MECNRARALAPSVLLILVFGGCFLEAGVIRRLLEGWVYRLLEFDTYPFPFGSCLGGTSLLLSHVDLFTPCLIRCSLLAVSETPCFYPKILQTTAEPRQWHASSIRFMSSFVSFCMRFIHTHCTKDSYTLAGPHHWCIPADT